MKKIRLMPVSPDITTWVDDIGKAKISTNTRKSMLHSCVLPSTMKAFLRFVIVLNLIVCVRV